ncbi:tetratricopeptide repeat protein [Methylobacterium iners]|uniref:Localization factor PodJL n=1 Tax=Methylobacterium iners TaxID=418707 RepID=A0ABQ4RVU5_9HYPH|nr:tetratricopeptide repeat protein [Methylobacterium iners]GJD94971.1 hypothetical protein OCOJLMKI_2179 [Methylobacterium iners]
MKRNATLSLDGFDPEIVEAAREVASRAGLPVEAWIASVLSPEEKAQQQRRRRRPVRSTERPAEAPPRQRVSEPATQPVPVASGADETAITQMMRRLDALDRRIAEEREAAQAAASQTIAGIEARIGAVLETGLSPATQMAERLGDIERRMTELAGQLAAPRPLGRRGRPPEAEVRDAVSEIRQRQRELEGRGRAEPTEPAVQAAAPAPGASSLVISELQIETSRLRESIGGLATGRDVSALEQAMLSLATGVQQAQEPSELAAIAAPIELIRVQVARLAEDVAENVHARVASDVERLAAKVDGALSGGSASADREALAALFRELEEIRRLIGALAGPERIQSLAQGMQAISAQIAQLQGTARDESGVAELRPLLEEIRSDLRRPEGRGIEEQIRAMGVKLDALKPQNATGGTDSDAIIHRIDALADKVERASVNPVGDLIGRLEDLGATLRQPPQTGGELASIHGMLRDLAEKIDRVGDSGTSAEGLDGLEQQVLALSRRIDSRGADPALAGLERTMGELLAQVSALRDEAPLEAAMERAARNAVAETMAGGRAEAGGSSEIGLLRAGLADLRSQQAAAEQRMQATLEGVHSVLNRLVGRLGSLEGEGALGAGPRRESEPLTERLLSSTSAPKPRAPAVRRPDAPRVPGPAATVDIAKSADLAKSVDLARAKDELLEPGAGRPLRDPAPAVELPEDGAAAGGDIKTSFIAAARRAAQAAQAEASASAKVTSDLRGGAESVPIGLTARAGGRAARLRAEIDRRRRPLLLGLAAVVLALGALQAFSLWTPGNPEPASPPMVEAPAKPAGASDGVAAARPDGEGASVAASRADPQTTQALPSPGAASDPIPPAPAESVGRTERPAARGLPRVPSAASLGPDLANVPAGLAKLRQSALEGDGAAIFELAARHADGRGMTRDLALAAKLYEKLATAGYAPAQYKLASQYEKGSGLVRDVAQAKTWYGRAAEQGHARSMHNLAVLHAENPAANGKPDFAAAAQWFRQAAEHGIRDSQYNLAVLYARGLGLQQDLVQSYAWFSAAGAQGDDDAAKKRDDVAGKLAPKDLAAAKALAANFKAKVADPAINEAPAQSAAGNTMTLLGSPLPATPPAAGRRT